MLPKDVEIESQRHGRLVPVAELGATEVPPHDGGGFSGQLQDSANWGGHARDGALEFLRSWIFPTKVQEVRDRVERALEDGVPDQRRVVLRNQDFGNLDDRWIADLAIGDDVDRPFMRWSKRASDEVRVAICLDAATPWYTPAETIEARMCVAAGLAAALETLDYEVSVVGALLCSPSSQSKAREGGADACVVATVMKDEAEPLVDSGFAPFADSDLRRLLTGWSMKSNWWPTNLSDPEWRRLIDADLFVYLGDSNAVYNQDGLPAGTQVGLKGEDVVSLEISGHADVDGAVSKLESFFSFAEGAL